MKIRPCCCLVVILLHLLECTHSHLTIPIAQKNGNDEKCLKNHLITPCRTLKYVLQYILESNETSVDISFIGNYRYLISPALQIHTEKDRILNLRIMSYHVAGISLTCSGDARRIFDVYGSSLTLEFHNITFAHCGQGNKDVIPVITANDTKKISYYSCIFQDNQCGAFFAINTDIHIEYSIFQRNSIKRIYNSHIFQSYDVSAFSGGLGILFLNERRSMSVHVFQTRFTENRVYIDDSEYYVAQKQENAVKNGGAMHVTFMNKSTYWTTINVTSCFFERNEATFGGALLIELFGTTLYNKIFISSTQFLNNNGSQAGGAFLLSMWDFSAKTELTMVDTVFQENWSRSGSAIYVFFESSYTSPHKSLEILLFKRLQVVGNRGPVASSVKIACHRFGPRSIDQVPIFENCLFENNTNDALNRYAYLASFIIDSVNITFKGTNKFIGNNFFGAVYFSNSHIHVYGKLYFLRNVGLQGGAISMQNSQIVVYPGSDLLFQDNYATLEGGAINVVTNVVYHVGVINNPFCFLVYSELHTAPDKWNATISFINNTAVSRGPAICIDSLVMCAWNPNSEKIDFKQALKWKPTFHYEGNVLCPSPYLTQQCYKSANSTNAIATFASSLQETSGIKTIETCSGEEAVLDIIAKDELNNSVFTIISDQVANSHDSSRSWFKSPAKFTAIYPNNDTVRFKYTYNGKPHNNETADVYYFDLFSNGRVFTHFTLRSVPCRHGFIQKDDSCICDMKPGILGCTTDGHYVQYKEGYWVGVINGVFTILPCPFGYCSCLKLPKHGTAISGCFYNVVNKTDVCAHERTGTLCGDCKENYTVGIEAFRCVPRKQHTGCIATTVSSFIFTLLFCILILYFNPGLDNELRGPLFFFQVLPLFFPLVQYTTKGTINVYNFVFFVASIFDFTIPFFGFFFSKCYIIDNQDSLDMLAWSYSSSVIALLVFLSALLLTCKRVILIRRKNAVQSFWVLLILMYSSLMRTSLRIIDCLHVQGKNRLFLQASVTCGEGKHLVLTIVAWIILILGIIIPMLIIVATKTNRLKIAPHYLDTLTHNLKETCVFWWSVDLLRRFLIVALCNFIHIWLGKQVALILAATFILSIHCYFQPYKETRANISEMIFLFVLSGFGVPQLLDIEENQRDRTNWGIVCIMFSYTLILAAIKLVVFVQNRTKCAADDEYERISDEGSTTRAIFPTTDKSLEQRREKLEFLFSRSETSRLDDETQNLTNNDVS